MNHCWSRRLTPQGFWPRFSNFRANGGYFNLLRLLCERARKENHWLVCMQSLTCMTTRVVSLVSRVIFMKIAAIVFKFSPSFGSVISRTGSPNHSRFCG